VAGFKRGKHAFAWAAAKAMPTFHYQALAVREGLKGCGGCHKLGVKSEAEAKELKETAGGYGVASCDACHTRHLFSKAEAMQPEACKTCHWSARTAEREVGGDVARRGHGDLRGLLAEFLVPRLHRVRARRVGRGLSSARRGSTAAATST
jgi:hypothetical protein